jgi:hypothetical protein
MGFNLNGVVDGQNIYESHTLKYLESAPRPWYTPVNAPFLLPAYLVGKLIGNMLLGARVISFAYCLLSALCIFLLAKMWFNVRIATVVLLLFASSSWLLILSHSATFYSLLVASPLLLLTSLAWFFRTKKHRFISFLVFSIFLAFSLYVPYMFWVALFVMAVLIFKERKKLLLLKRWQIILPATVFLILLTPLFYATMHYPGLIKMLIGVPIEWPSIPQYFINLFSLYGGLFLQSKPLPELTLGKLPLLDIFSSAMLVLGIYYFISRWPNRRSVLILCCLAFLPLILALDTHFQMYLALLIPFIYLTVIVGFIELINQWVAYFPRNPLAKNIGIALVVLSISMISFYHLQRFYVAWPNSPQTKSVYVVKSR